MHPEGLAPVPAPSSLQATALNLSKRRRQAQGRFTLIELLVVIAIIAILASMLLPALRKAKEQGLGATCLNNIKQVALGYALYADANDGFMPSARHTLGGWYCNNTVAKYISSGAQRTRDVPVFRCPADHGFGLRPAYRLSYGIQAYATAGYSNQSSWLYYPPLRQDDPRSTDRTGLIVENYGHCQAEVTSNAVTVPDGSYGTAPAFRHVNKCAVAYYDLHAALCQPRAIPCYLGYPWSVFAQRVNTFFCRGEPASGFTSFTVPGL